MEMRIKSVSARPDAIDALVWTTELRLVGWGSDQLFLLASWSGDVVLYRQEVGKGSGMGEQVKRVHLPARWLRADERRALHAWANASREILLETLLPGDALERIETFRGDDPLFARLEGKVFMFRVMDNQAESMPANLDKAQADLWQALAFWRGLADPQRIIGVDFRTETYEVSRERWDREIRGKLRNQPLDFAPSQASPRFEPNSVMNAKGLIIDIPASLQGARTDFAERRYKQCIEKCIRELSTIQPLASDTNGESMRVQLKALSGVVAHDEFTLAYHMLISTASLCRWTES